MSCFKLPEGLIKDKEIIVQKFWWGYNGDTRKVHWVKWERLCKAKEVGAMGFKEIENFNHALLSKQVWRMIKNPDSLCHKVFKDRFFRIAQFFKQMTRVLAFVHGRVSLVLNI